MNIIKNSIIIIHDYEYENIKNIQEQAVGFWVEHYMNLFGTSYPIVSPIVPSGSGKEYTFFINGACFSNKDFVELQESYGTIKKWCDFIYKKFLPQNIVVLTISDGGESYIEYQLPKIEEYHNG